jgi:hypothetical protein
MRKKLLGLKEELKQLAKSIKKAKPEFKEAQRKLGYDSMINSLRKLYKLRYEFRHKHIVYCQLRGRTREQIEVPREYNRPNEKYIDELTGQYGKTLCVGT